MLIPVSVSIAQLVEHALCKHKFRTPLGAFSMTITHFLNPEVLIPASSIFILKTYFKVNEYRYDMSLLYGVNVYVHGPALCTLGGRAGGGEKTYSFQ